MKLVDIYEDPAVLDTAARVLYLLLEERERHESISHKHMPTFVEHMAFVSLRPYQFWYLIEVDGYFRGACYLSKQREIGVFIFKGQRGHKYGLGAVALLMKMHPGRFLANVNPGNEASAKLFKSLGFGLIQHTYERGMT